MKVLSVSEMQVANGGRYKCGYCGKIKDNPFTMRYHQRTWHAIYYIKYGYNFWWV